jgi:LPS-assembly lipoprotein
MIMVRRAIILLFAAASLALAACGFTPLYGAPGMVADLAAIEVTAPQGRTGFLLRQSLDDALAHNGAVAPLYRLGLAITEQKIPRGVRVDNVANRYELVLSVNYTLTTTAGAPAKAGRITTSVTYDSADQPYASIAAEQDGQERAAAEAARQIHLDLASWMANRPRT